MSVFRTIAVRSAVSPESTLEVDPLEENQVRKQEKKGCGWTALGYVLGALLALAAPLAVLSELMWLLPVLLVPSVGIALLYRWFGRGPALCTAILQVMMYAVMLGAMGMWIAISATMLPLIALMLASRRPFFEQLRISIASFFLGVVLAVGLLYLSFGGDAIARMLDILPQSLRALPTEWLDQLIASLSEQIASGMTAESFIGFFDEAVAQLTPVYQSNLPGLIFGGALVSALICAPAMAVARGADCVPFREWALPASTTSGLLLILLVSFVLGEAGMQGANVALQAVLDIAVIAFCVQALSSFARRLHQAGKSVGMQRGMIAVLAVLAWFGASLYLAIYGCASALFGSRGALKQYSKKNQDK